MGGVKLLPAKDAGTGADPASLRAREFSS